MKYFLNLAFAACLALAAGCTTTSRETASGGGLPATCHVCRYHNDLACVCVKVKNSTPRAEYQGTTYYFCSDDCRADFLKQPEKYLPKARTR